MRFLIVLLLGILMISAVSGFNFTEFDQGFTCEEIELSAGVLSDTFSVGLSSGANISNITINVSIEGEYAYYFGEVTQASEDGSYWCSSAGCGDPDSLVLYDDYFDDDDWSLFSEYNESGVGWSDVLWYYHNWSGMSNETEYNITYYCGHNGTEAESYNVLECYVNDSWYNFYNVSGSEACGYQEALGLNYSVSIPSNCDFGGGTNLTTVGSCDCVCGAWTAAAGGSFVVDAVTYKENGLSLSLVKTSTVVDSVLYTANNAFTPADLGDDTLHVWVYIKDGTALGKLDDTNGIILKYGNVYNDNYYYKTYAEDNLTTGWNDLNLSKADSLSHGSPSDPLDTGTIIINTDIMTSTFAAGDIIMDWWRVLKSSPITKLRSGFNMSGYGMFYELELFNTSLYASSSPMVENLTLFLNGSYIGWNNDSVFNETHSIALDPNWLSHFYRLNDNLSFNWISNYSGNISYCLELGNYSNILNITIRDEVTDNIITSLIDIGIGNEEGSDNYSTTTGLIQLQGQFLGDYTLTFTSSTYSERELDVSFAEGESVFITAYMSISNETVVFTIVDDISNEYMENVSVVMQGMINDTWTSVESQFSDVSGRLRFYYTLNERYRFVLTFDGYATKIFVLDPILFDTYTVKMQRSQAYGEDIDGFGVTMIHSPHQFFNDRGHEFTFLISSPAGILSTYGYNITYPNGTTTTQSNSGITSIGESWDVIVNISDAEITDRVIIEWYYDSTLGELRSFRQIYTIDDYNPDAGTWLYNQRDTFGMGLLERVLICVLAAIIVGGFITLVAGAEMGGLVGLFVMGVFAYILAINIFMILLSVLVGFLIVARRSGD